MSNFLSKMDKIMEDMLADYLEYSKHRNALLGASNTEATPALPTNM